jgi:hypothetical protein
MAAEPAGAAVPDDPAAAVDVPDAVPVPVAVPPLLAAVAGDEPPDVQADRPTATTRAARQAR